MYALHFLHHYKIVGPSGSQCKHSVFIVFSECLHPKLRCKLGIMYGIDEKITDTRRESNPGPSVSIRTATGCANVAGQTVKLKRVQMVLLMQFMFDCICN